MVDLTPVVGEAPVLPPRPASPPSPPSPERPGRWRRRRGDGDRPRARARWAPARSARWFATASIATRAHPSGRPTWRSTSEPSATATLPEDRRGRRRLIRGAVGRHDQRRRRRAARAGRVDRHGCHHHRRRRDPHQRPRRRRDATEIRVRLAGETEPREATLLAADPGNDLALLRIAGDGFAPATFADPDSVRIGDEVVAIGFALDLDGDPSVTLGIVSALDRTIQTARGCPRRADPDRCRDLVGQLRRPARRRRSARSSASTPPSPAATPPRPPATSASRSRRRGTAGASRRCASRPTASRATRATSASALDDARDGGQGAVDHRGRRTTPRPPTPASRSATSSIADRRRADRRRRRADRRDPRPLAGRRDRGRRCCATATTQSPCSTVDPRAEPRPA